MKGLQPIPAKPLYTATELGRMLGVSRHLVNKLLRLHGVFVYRVGRYQLVPLVEIRDKLPPVWRAVLLTNEIRK